MSTRGLHRAPRRWGWIRLRSLASFLGSSLAFFLVLSLVLSLAGCGSLIPGTGPPPDLYNLTPKSTFPSDLPTVSQQLVIEEPLAAGGLDNFRIALRPSPTELDYFSGARWTERAPAMVQSLMVESFENSNAITAVGRQAIGLSSDYSLKAELREFQAEHFDGEGFRVRVRINAKLIRQPRQIIVASQSFETVTPVTGTGMRAIIGGFDGALGSVLKDLVEWTLRSMAAEPGQ